VIVAPGAPWGSGDGLGAQFSCSVEDYLVSWPLYSCSSFAPARVKGQCAIPR
jgi:hypothetical protein